MGWKERWKIKSRKSRRTKGRSCKEKEREMKKMKERQERNGLLREDGEGTVGMRERNER